MGFKVVDASVLLHSKPDFAGHIYIAPNSVVLEVIDERARIFVDAAIRDGSLRVVDPSEKSLKLVVSKAVENGDIDALSKADLDVIALALEKKAVVVSDDYAIQNTARHLGLRTENAAQEGIKKTVCWVRVCEGCGRKYETSKNGTCPVCGSRLVKKPFT